MNSKRFKLRFYSQYGPHQGDCKCEIFFNTRDEMLRVKKEMYEEALGLMNPTAWEFTGLEWRRV